MFLLWAPCFHHILGRKNGDLIDWTISIIRILRNETFTIIAQAHGASSDEPVANRSSGSVRFVQARLRTRLYKTYRFDRSFALVTQIRDSLYSIESPCTIVWNWVKAHFKFTLSERIEFSQLLHAAH